jgi:outer membrane cobalamin receptor
MRSYIIILFIIILFPTFLSAQSVEGIITDSRNGEPVQNAAVVLFKTGKGEISDNNGRFKLNLIPGKNLIEFRHVGYVTQRREILAEANRNITMNIEMVPEIYQQEQIVVTANKIGMNRDNVIMNVSVINQLQIEQSSESNILPVISAQVPGLFVTGRGITGFGVAAGSAGKISIRGLGGTDASFPVLLLIDGQPQFMGMMGHPIPDSYVTSDIEKVELVKGPASILYGTNAMGGAINLITRGQKEEGLSARGRLMYGSFNTQKYAASAGYRHNRLSVLASYNHDQTDGQRPNSDFNIDNIYLKVGYELSPHFIIDANASQSAFKAYDPGPVNANPTDYANKSQWVDIERTNYYFTLSNKFDKSEGGVKAYYMTGDHDIYTGWKSNDENMGISIYQGIRLSDHALLSVGADAKRYGGRGTLPALGNFSGKWIEVEETGIYAIMQQTLLKKITLTAGVRYDNHSMFEGQWIPQFGAVYKATPNTNLKISASKGFRNPTIRDLYLFPPANSELVPENMWNYEFTVTRGFADGKGQAEITAFMAEGDNLIIAAPNPAPPPPVKNQNTGAFSHKGIEADIRYRVTRKFNLSSSYSYLNMDTPKVSAPEHQFYSGGSYHAGRFDISAGIQYIGNLYTRVSAPDNIVKESYTLVNSRISYHFNRNLTWFASGENLLNQQYQMQYGYPMPGITLFTGININL